MSDYLGQYKRSQKPRRNNTGSGTPCPGEVWWVSNLDGIKDRPILVLRCESGTVTFRKCTSQHSCTVARTLIEDYLEAGLDKETYVDPNVRTIPRNRLVRRMGKLSDYDLEKFGIKTE